ncbi:hypothetical protein WJX72_001552 [[Myrmecia] bisecta]|uniref:Transducin beta-like protein 2 n=1 Tax=[Myrmecia] bisecta TaxID=41462 RepID=A0AAW1QER9_9CHLO
MEDSADTTAKIEDLSGSTQAVLYVLGVFFVTVVLVLCTSVFRFLARSLFPSRSQPAPAKRPSKQELQRPEPVAEPKQEKVAAGVSLKQLMRDSKSSKAKASSALPAAGTATHHPLYLNTLKGHVDTVNGLAFSPTGTAIATACEDRALRIFKLEDVTSKSIGFRRKNLTRGPVDVGFGASDDELVAVTKGTLDAAALSMYISKANQKSGEGSVLEPVWEVDNVHAGDAALCMHSRNGVILTCSKKTDMRVYSSRGRQLAAMDTAGLQNHMADLSPNGRFAAAATFTSDVKVVEIKHDKEGNFQGCSKVMDLKGHKSQVMCLSFSPDSSRMVTASKDGTWCVWNIAVRYWLQEDPKQLLKRPQEVPANRCYTHIAYGPGGVIAASIDKTLYLLDAKSGSLVDTVEDAHDAEITCMEWSPALYPLGDHSESAVLATGSRDKKCQVGWPGLQVLVVSYQLSLQTS